MTQLVSPSRIMEVGFGFWDSKALLTDINIPLLSSNSARAKSHSVQIATRKQTEIH
jgi:hypothetical protein